MIDLKLRSKSFHGKEILRNIAIKTEPHARLALMGPSGIGKTTLLRIIAGLDHDYEGDYQVPDKIALMFQEPNLLPWRNVAQNLEIFHPQIPTSEILAHLEEVGLLEKAKHFPSQLSLGQQRRLALLRAFITPCDLVLLDEPFASLDNATTDDMIALTHGMLARHNSTLILVTHDQSAAKKLGAIPLTLVGNPAAMANCG